MCDRNTHKIPYMLFKKTNADGRELYTATSVMQQTNIYTSSDNAVKDLQMIFSIRFVAMNAIRANAADPGWMDRESPRVIRWYKRAGDCVTEILPRQFIEINL